MRLARHLCQLALAVFVLTSSGASAGATILVFGDSLSAGYGLRQDAAWPALLARKLADERRDYTVVNLSITGETTAGGRSRLPAALKAHRPQVLVLGLGANDGLRGLPLAQMQENIEAMLELAAKAKARVLLVGMRLPPNYGEYATGFAGVYATVARQRKVPLVPFLLDGFAEQAEFFQADGLHPTAAAQARILDTVLRGLRPLLD